jgi:hypothetical protein
MDSSELHPQAVRLNNKTSNTSSVAEQSYFQTVNMADSFPLQKT